MSEPEQIDTDVRLHVYRRFLEDGRPPTVDAVAAALDVSREAAEESLRRLEASRVLVFAPGTLNVWMANPLSAFPTTFWVETPRGGWWGTCVWDALGIPAMLGTDGAISTLCADCNEPLEIRVEAGSLATPLGVAHFAVPARRWWENIGYT